MHCMGNSGKKLLALETQKWQSIHFDMGKNEMLMCSLQVIVRTYSTSVSSLKIVDLLRWQEAFGKNYTFSAA